MRRIISGTFLSLDGVMQAPGGPDEDLESGFQFGGWAFHYFDEESGAALDEVLEKPFDLLLGRKTYDIFAGYWPRVSDDNPIAKRFNAVTKYVATRGGRPLEWNNSQSLGDDIVASLRGLKKSDGPDLLIQGSGDMIQTLLRHSLIDEFTVFIFPLILGKGKRLFAEGAIPAGLKLVESRSFPKGGIMARYQPAGEIKTGSFALEEPS